MAARHGMQKKPNEQVPPALKIDDLFADQFVGVSDKVDGLADGVMLYGLRAQDLDEILAFAPDLGTVIRDRAAGGLLEELVDYLRDDTVKTVNRMFVIDQLGRIGDLLGFTEEK